MDYVNQICPVCKKVFTANDDIVVCPVCGTPHHRECYKQTNNCANEIRHDEGYSWQPTITEVPKPVMPVPPTARPNMPIQKDDGHKVIFCPNCGKENPAEEPVCLNCGARLYNTQNGGRPFVPPVELPNMYNQQFSGGPIPISPSDTIGQNTVADTAEFIGINAQAYIPKFYKAEKENKKSIWNWASFFFAPYWFFYRKMQLVGFIMMLIMLAVSGFCTTSSTIAAENALSQKMEGYQNGTVTQQELMDDYTAYVKMPQNLIVIGVGALIHIYSGFMGNFHYRKKVEKDIAEIKKTSENPEQYRIALFKKGGVSFLLLALSIIGYNAASQLVFMLVSKLIL